jgi:hypothetical protein
MNSTLDKIIGLRNIRDVRLSNYKLIFFSATPWDSIFKRPQKLSLKLSERYKALYIEYRVTALGKGAVKLRNVSPNLDILSVDVNHPEDFNIFLGILAENGKIPAVAYLFSVVFHSVPYVLSCRKVIYDCMNDFCPLQPNGFNLIKMERNLLNKATAVITSTRTLFDSKLQHHPNVHYIPGTTYSDGIFENQNPEAVMNKHFTTGKTIGYAGVVDERIDLDLIYNTARLLPDYTFVLVGPLEIKIDPKREVENVYFLGKKPLEKLHSYIEFFDVCMVPFVTNEKTKHLCPSKLLDYMRAKKNILCTKLPCTLREFPICVDYISDEKDFEAKIRKITTEKTPPNLNRYSVHLQNRSWSNTLLKLKPILE